GELRGAVMTPETPRPETVSERAFRLGPGRKFGADPVRTAAARSNGLPHRLGRNGIGPTLAAVLCAVTVGCAASPPPPVIANPDPPPHEQILRALDCYDPMYQVDEDGRGPRLNPVWKHLPRPVPAGLAKPPELPPPPPP